MADTSRREPSDAAKAAPGRVSVRHAAGWAIGLVRPVGRVFAASVGASLLLLLATQFNVQVLANLVTMLSGHSSQQASGLALLFAVSSVLVIGLTVASRLLGTWSDTTMVAALQRRLHDKLLALPMASRVRPDQRGASVMVLQSAPLVQPLLRDVLATPLVSGITLLTAIALLIYNLDSIRQANAGSEAALVITLLLLPIGAMLVAGRLRMAFDTYGRSVGELGQEMANSAADSDEIAMLGGQAQRSRRFGSRLQAVVTRQLAAALRLEAARQFQSSLPVLVQGILLIYAAFQLQYSDGRNLGGILAIYYFAPAAVRPMQSLLNAYLQLSANWGAVAQIGAVLDAAAEPSPAASHAMAPPQVTLDALHFGYAAMPQPLLRGVSHVFAPCSTTAIVGRSGSGKSTLLAVLAGLLEADGGTVLVDGVAPGAMRQSGRGAIALLSQSPLVIADTIRENFRLAGDDIDDATIEAVCREVGLWPILEGIADGPPLDLVLRARPGQPFPAGALPSGARRLLGVARVLLLKPRLLLLDEPTAGVDALALDVLSACLRRVARETTLIVVEHNIDFIHGLAGLVCCLEDGRFAAIGAPAALAEQPGLFRSMVRARAALLDTGRMSIQSVPLPTLSGGVG